ncbi:MAG: hypothetical protein ACK5UT_15035, partial [Acidobacteriota bacterium]
MTRLSPALLLTCLGLAAEPLPPGPAPTRRAHSHRCPAAPARKGGVNLQHTNLDWSAPAVRALWPRALRGRNGYELITRLMLDPNLDMTHATLDSD